MKKIKEVFSKRIKGPNKYEIEKKINKSFRGIISELDEFGILIFKTSEVPYYYQERKFLLPGQIFVNAKQDLVSNTLGLSLEYFHSPTENVQFYFILDFLEGLADKYELKKQNRKKEQPINTVESLPKGQGGVIKKEVKRWKDEFQRRGAPKRDKR